MNDLPESVSPREDLTGSAVKAPDLSWFPVRYIEEIAEGRRSESWWLPDAERFGFRFVELHQSFVDEPVKVARMEQALHASGLGVAMITGASDLVHPLAERRAEQKRGVRNNIEVAARLGAPAVRITTGLRHDAVPLDVGLTWIAEAAEELGQFAEARGVTLCVENHFRDRTWPLGAVDFAAEPNRFRALYKLLNRTRVRINYDSSQPMVVDGDELVLLESVAPRIFHVHLGDRVRGSRSHSVLGEGDVRIPAILARLRALRYDRFLSIEDGSREGNTGLERGLAFVRKEVDRCWRENGSYPDY
jgi:sugar phosphate isomerase/epimerase